MRNKIEIQIMIKMPESWKVNIVFVYRQFHNETKLPIKSEIQKSSKKSNNQVNLKEI